MIRQPTFWQNWNSGVLKCYKPSRTLHLGHVVVLRNRLRLIKQVCFNTLKNDIFGSTIINYTSLTVNHRKQRRSCLQAIKPRFNRWIWGKNKCILSRVHKPWSFYNIYFSINLLMGKPKVSRLSAKRNWHVLLTRACYSFDCWVLIVTNFSTCWLQLSFSIMLGHFIFV